MICIYSQYPQRFGENMSPRKDDRDVPYESQDPADRDDEVMTEAMDRAGVPRRKRSHNAGGNMSETTRSRTEESG
jgi:hypothetical protein